jgi:hypothetical protein
MRWSAIVKRYEPFIAPALAGRLRLHATRYRGAHDGEGRGWITLDGKQIASFESLPYLMRIYGLSHELKGIGLEPDPAWDMAIEAAHREGLFYLWDYQGAVLRYPDHSVEEARASPDPMIRALAMFDRRLGRRRLEAMIAAPPDYPIIRLFYKVRCEAEGIATSVD